MAGRVRIPVHLQETAKEIAARTWAKNKDFKQKLWFSAIDIFSQQLSAFTQDDAENDQIVPLIARMVYEERSLAEHVFKETDASISNDEVWLKMCEAAAWVIVQMYRLAVEKGEWPDEP